MNAQTMVGAVAGVLFGAGLTVSGMVDPARVRGFLDVFGVWDPTLAFVMGGAIIPMAIAWVVQRRRRAPVAAPAFAVPETGRVTPALVGGAALFGIGWGLGGLCPGPALAGFAIAPLPAATFTAAMVAGFVAMRAMAPPR